VTELSKEFDMQTLSDRDIARFKEKVIEAPGCWGWAASIHPQQGYALFWLQGKTHGAHRVAYTLANGPIPPGMFVDHACLNRGCVNPGHLRLATPKQNNENPAGLYRSNTSGISGVTWHKPTRKWEAAVSHHGKRVYAGRFTDIEDARQAVIAKRNELFTHNVLDRKAA
jgi:hypothetical protein